MLHEVLATMPPARVVPYDLSRENLTTFDFTAANTELGRVDLQDTAAFSRYVFSVMEGKGTRAGIGRHGENRTIYARSGLFSGSEPRTVHLGLDIWAAPGTAVLAAYAGRVHSWADNAGFGDYGPTIILEHELKGEHFYSLYGHLSRGSLSGLREGLALESGQKIGEIGDEEVNGHWPPHLHFMLIRDLEGRHGDFPGVCTMGDREHFLSICPNPNIALQIPGLD